MKLIQPKDIYPLGIGTFGLGTTRAEGDGIRLSDSEVARDLKTTLHRISLGHNYFETNYSYANGESLRFLASVFSLVPRDEVYLISKLTDSIHSEADVKFQIDRYLSLMGIDFVDEIGFTKAAAGNLPHGQIYEWLRQQISLGKSRFLHGANQSLDQLQQLKYQGITFASMEGLYNLECKNNEDNGVIDYCNQNNIVFVVYQPLRRNRTAARNYPMLVSLSQKYGVTQNQILINWIVKHKGLHILTKSSTILHADENQASLSLILSDADYTILDQFRSSEFDAIPVDWNNKGGIPINKLPNQLP